MTACSNDKVKKSIEQDLQYSVGFYPSFLNSCKIEFYRKSDKGKIKIEINGFTRYNKFTTIVDSAEFSEQDVQHFLNQLDTIDLLKAKTILNDRGMDGITVSNTVSIGTRTNVFQFWSPDKTKKEHKIVEALIGMSRQKFRDLKHQEYFELLEQYFDFGLPCKITQERPLEIRIYGSLSSNEEQELNKFVNDLPSDRSILIDMTNFNGMGTMFYPLFQNLIRRNDKIFWASTYKTQLKEIGVDTTKIFEKVVDTRNALNNYCR